jgi:hypothetical protein
MYNTHETNLRFMKNIYGRPFVVSITDGSSHYDVAFSTLLLANDDESLYQSGIATQPDSILVAINRYSCFIFSIEGKKHENYVEEKLGLRGDCLKQVTELINSICR